MHSFTSTSFTCSHLLAYVAPCIVSHLRYSIWDLNLAEQFIFDLKSPFSILVLSIANALFESSDKRIMI
jgi:hypothetical protein